MYRVYLSPQTLFYIEHFVSKSSLETLQRFSFFFSILASFDFEFSCLVFVPKASFREIDQSTKEAALVGSRSLISRRLGERVKQSDLGV